MDKLPAAYLTDLADVLWPPHLDQSPVNDHPHARLAYLLREEAARREGKVKRRICTEVYHGALCIFDCGDGPCKHAAIEQKPVIVGVDLASGADVSVKVTGHVDGKGGFVVESVEREGLGSAAACHAASDGECTWAECPQEKDGRRNYQSSCPLLDNAPFRLEVGKSYARRDGTGPVKIVADDREAWPMRDAEDVSYTRDGFLVSSTSPHSRDLVSLWQAEAPQPTPAMQCAKCGPQGCDGACLEAPLGGLTAAQAETQAPQTDADDVVAKLEAAERAQTGTAWPRHLLYEARSHIEAQAREIALDQRGLIAKQAALDATRAERDALKARVARLEDALQKIEHIWTAKPIPDPDRPGYFQPLFDEPIKETLTLVRAAREGDKTDG